MKLMCSSCKYLDKSKKEVHEEAYRYGCSRHNGYISFWLLNDSDLKTGGCSYYEEKSSETEQLRLKL